MSQDNTQERTEQPTEKRKKENKEKGNVARSKDFNSMLVLLGGGIGIVIFGQNMFKKISGLFTYCFTFDATLLHDIPHFIAFCKKTFFSGIIIITPLLLLIFMSVLFGSMLVGGWSFSLQAVSLKFERLDPFKGLAKIFSLNSLMELFKSSIKIIIILISLGGIYYFNLNKMIALSFLESQQAIHFSVSILMNAFFILCIGIAVVSLIDVPYQFFAHANRIKMTKQEMKDEFKETEGRPEVKSKISQIQRTRAKRRIQQEVPKADVIITNPTHYAVALKYDKNNMKAPMVVAKGMDHMAFTIIELGKKHAITLVNLPPLARSIYYHTEVNHEIPVPLYVSVAKVLGYVYQLKEYRKGRMKKPQLPKEIDIPEEMKK